MIDKEQKWWEYGAFSYKKENDEFVCRKDKKFTNIPIMVYKMSCERSCKSHKALKPCINNNEALNSLHCFKDLFMALKEP